MANKTKLPDYIWSYEYYVDYVEPPLVDAKKLKVNRYSIVIAFWIGLAAFVAFLFFILFYVSRSGSTPIKNGGPQKMFPWNDSRNIPHHNHVANHTRPNLADNKMEKIEMNCLVGHHDDLNNMASDFITTETM